MLDLALEGRIQPQEQAGHGQRGVRAVVGPVAGRPDADPGEASVEQRVDDQSAVEEVVLDAIVADLAQPDVLDPEEL